MPYPSRPTLNVLAEFVGTAGEHQTPQQRAALIRFVAMEYQAGRSLRELGELTGRTQTAIRRALHQGGVPTRGRGAQALSDDSTAHGGEGLDRQKHGLRRVAEIGANALDGTSSDTYPTRGT
ncbi:helix-turn-helix domain-containing protein [Knoellia sp. CPCC 206435]|uniref:helix-turn-helix domain-containing protein n=1 Tax=Knoellia terrae TaxID=3404797 RepID=UPI003B42D2A3